jgi:hypothetical protein
MMKTRLILMVAAAFCFAAAPAFAQHGHEGTAGGAGGSHGPAMGNAGEHGANATTGTASSSPAVLSNNAKLDSKLTSKLQAKGLLPAGTDLKDACNGFRNLGQCMAAIHVSHNLKVPFDCFKWDMTGIAAPSGTTCPAGTGSSTSKLSLGKTIQALVPTANSKTEGKTATTEADADIKEAQSAS